MKKLIAILCVSIFALSLCACGSSSSSGSSSRQGFTGSDGKYHDYVPEFGNDVNEWMANNW